MMNSIHCGHSVASIYDHVEKESVGCLLDSCGRNKGGFFAGDAKDYCFPDTEVIENDLFCLVVADVPGID